MKMIILKILRSLREKMIRCPETGKFLSCAGNNFLFPVVRKLRLLFFCVLFLSLPIAGGETAASGSALLTEADFLFFNIVPCTPGKEKKSAERMIELEKKTGIRYALYSLTLHPEGYPASRKVDILVESYRKFAGSLKGTRVRPGVLMQSILGHWTRVDKKEESWTRTVNIHGASPRFCPLDPEFQKYIINVSAALAKKKPAVILIDDDVRSWFRGAECFCPRHVAEFNRRTGKNHSSEELRKLVMASKVGDAVQAAFAQLQKDMVLLVCSLVRQGIDSVDPSIPAGTCMPDWDRKTGGESAVKIAGKNIPIMRVASPLYMEQTSFNLPENHLNTLALSAYHGKKVPILLDEADTCPHTLFSKSARSFHTKLCSAMFAGMKGAVIWCVNGEKITHPVSRKYTDVLEKYRIYDQVLSKTIQKSQPEGIIIPLYERSLAWYPKGWPCEHFISGETWVKQFLGMYGIPFRVSFRLDEEGIYALSGRDAVDRLTDDEIRSLLKRKVLLDGPAAAALTQRGFSSMMGVKAELKSFRFNREADTNGTQIYSLTKNPNIPYLSEMAKGAESLTSYYYVPFSASPEKEFVAPGAVLYRNRDGGVICTTAFHSSVLWSWAQSARKQWLLKIIKKMDDKHLLFTAVEEQPIMLLQRKLADGKTLLGLFNLGFDPLESCEIYCAAKPSAVEYLTLDGTWKKLPLAWKDGILSIPIRVECYEQTVFRISK